MEDKFSFVVQFEEEAEVDIVIVQIEKLEGELKEVQNEMKKHLTELNIK